MRRFSGFLFWPGLLLLCVVAALALTDNGISEVIVGLMFAAERDFLPIACLSGAALVGLSLAIRRRTGLALPRWRAGLLGLSVLGTVVLAFIALNPGFSTSEVGYDSEGVEMRATLYLPAADERAPAIVIVPGSAPFPRQSYDAYARRLVKQGYAVLLADKRGAGESGGVFESRNNGSIENLSLLANDVVAGVEFVAEQPAVDPQRVGLFGISQAGWVSVLAASQSSDISFLVMVTAPTVSVGEEGVWSDLRGDDETDPLAGFAEAELQIQSTEPFGFDPRDYLMRLTIPSFWLFGDSDNSIPSNKSISILRSVPNADVKLYSNFGHMLIGRGSGSLYDIAPESWQDVYDWLDKADLGT